MPSDPVPCKLCQAAAVCAGAKNTFRLFRCGKCGLLFVHPVPEDLLEIYNDRYFSGATEGHGYTDYDRDKEPMRPVFEEYLQRIEGVLGKPGRLLDVGAATGYFLDICRQRGWSTAGVEPSDFAASLGRNKGLDVRTGVLPDCGFAPGSFDAVTLWDVLEHVPDPEKTVQDVVQLLKPGGIFAFNTPDVDSAWARTMGMHWHLIVPPEHIHLFGRKSAVELLTKCAFLPLEVTTIGKTFTIQYVLKTLGQWLKLPLFTRSAEWMRGTRLGNLLGNLGVPINLRDNMFVMARLKPERRI